MVVHSNPHSSSPFLSPPLYCAADEHDIDDLLHPPSPSPHPTTTTATPTATATATTAAPTATIATRSRRDLRRFDIDQLAAADAGSHEPLLGLWDEDEEYGAFLAGLAGAGKVRVDV